MMDIMFSLDTLCLGNDDGGPTCRWEATRPPPYLGNIDGGPKS